MRGTVAFSAVNLASLTPCLQQLSTISQRSQNNQIFFYRVFSNFLNRVSSSLTGILNNIGALFVLVLIQPLLQKYQIATCRLLTSTSLLEFLIVTCLPTSLLFNC